MLYCSTELATHSQVTGQCSGHPPDSVLDASIDETQEADPDYDDDQEEFSFMQYSGGFV